MKKFEKCLADSFSKKNFELSPKSKFYAYIEAGIFPRKIKKIKAPEKWEHFNYDSKKFAELKTFLRGIFSLGH